MNTVVLIGRTTRDIELRYSRNQTEVARFTLAVDRGRDDGADFISCIAFGRTAKNMEKYVKKGSKIALRGQIRTGSYTKKNGEKAYTTDVLADVVEFIDTRKKSSESEESSGFIEVEEDIPF